MGKQDENQIVPTDEDRLDENLTVPGDGNRREEPPHAPKKRRRKVKNRSAEGTADPASEKTSKKAGPAGEVSESGQERPRRKRRTSDAGGAERKARTEGGKLDRERPRRKRRPASAGSAERRVRSEGGETGRSKRSSGKSRRSKAQETHMRRKVRKRTYVDVLKDLVTDNSLMAWMIKGLFCLLLFVIVLFVVRGIRNKGRDTENAGLTDSMSLADSGIAVELTELQKKTESFLEGGAGAVDDNSVTILGVGDNLVHEQVYLSAKTADGYDFRPFYKNVKQFISSADLATVNQETPLATSLGPASGYPHFNTPTEMGDALIDTGFDVANMGNNHMLDQGIDGAYVTREYWDDKNIPCTGFYFGYDDLFDYRIIEKNGIKIAFLSFVEMTNFELPSGYNAFIAYMNDGDLVKSMLEAAKSKADIVVVHAHWGDENTDLTTEYVYDEAQRLVDWGADIIFGNHSHVLQDLVTLTRESDGQKCPVIYSLGNFFSAQKVRDQLVSGILNVQVTKDPTTGKAVPSAMGFLPIVTHYTGDRENLSLYPFNMYSQEMAQEHGTAAVSTEGTPMSMDYIETLLGKHIPAQYLGRMGPIDQTSTVE